MVINANLKIKVDKALVNNIMKEILSCIPDWMESIDVKDYGDIDETDLNEYYSKSKLYTDILFANGTLKVVYKYRNESFELQYRDDEYILTLDKLYSGLKMIIEEYTHLINLNDIKNNIDGECSQYILQCALFNDIICG